MAYAGTPSWLISSNGSTPSHEQEQRSIDASRSSNNNYYVDAVPKKFDPTAQAVGQPAPAETDVGEAMKGIHIGNINMSRYTSASSSDSTRFASEDLDLYRASILEALEDPRNRPFLIQFEKSLITFLDSDRGSCPCGHIESSFHRLLVHRVAAICGLGHPVEPTTVGGKEIILVRSMDLSVSDAKWLSDAIHSTSIPQPSEPQPPGKFKLMQRASKKANAKPTSKIMLTGKSKPQLTLEEREEAYKAARERIFQDACSNEKNIQQAVPQQLPEQIQQQFQQQHQDKHPIDPTVNREEHCEPGEVELSSSAWSSNGSSKYFRGDNTMYTPIRTTMMSQGASWPVQGLSSTPTSHTDVELSRQNVPHYVNGYGSGAQYPYNQVQSDPYGQYIPPGMMIPPNAALYNQYMPQMMPQFGQGRGGRRPRTLYDPNASNSGSTKSKAYSQNR